MEVKRIPGKEKGDIMLYALSTCGWCKKTKALLDELGVAYSYLDVDLLEKEDWETAVKEIERWNPRVSFPTLVIDGQKPILGFQEEAIRKELG